MPTARNDLAAGVVNGILYAVGGKTANNCTGLTRVEAYDPVANSWSLKASLPAGRYGLGAAGVRDTLYAFGGDNNCSGALTTEVDAYDPTNDQWATRAPMQVARYSPASAVVGGVLYVIGGGAGSSQSSGSVEAYDPGTNAWSYKAPMPMSLRGFAAVVRDTIYVVGTDENGAIRTEAYDPVGDHWVVKQPMPEVRHAFSGGAANGALYVVGGISDVTHTWVSTVNAYDPASDTWTEVTSAPTARSRTAAGVLDGILYVVGGDLATADDVGVGTNEAFTPGSVAPSCLAPPSGLVSWWKGEGDANDLVGSNSGTLQGGVSFSAAEVGQGFAFGSDGDGVTIPNSPSLDVQSPGFTADFWMRGTKNQPENLATVFEKSHGWVDPTGWAFQIGSGGFPNDGVARFYLSDGTFSDIIGSVDVLDGNFHYLAGTWDGSLTSFYVDGVLQGTAFNTTPANNSRGVNIGFTWGGGVPRRFFRGTADELQVYNRALSATEIQAIFAAGSAGVCAPPPIRPPTASVGGPYSGVEEAAVSFDASASSDPQGLSLTYDWDFGDGSPHGSGATLTHVYANSGSYAVTVTVSNGSASASATTTTTIRPPSCAPAPNGLVSWWPAEGNANDVVGGNNGTPQSGATFSAGRVGQAFLFDGVDAYIDAGNASNLHLSSGDFTVEAWVRFNDLAGDQAIVSKFTLPPVFEGWSLLKQRDNRIWYCLGGGTSNRCFDPSFTLFSTTVAETGRWYHLAAVKGASGFSLYVNGVLEDARSPLPPLSDAQSANLLISAPAVSGAPVNGEVDEVSIYNRALNPTEVAAIHAAGSTGKCPPPVAAVGGPYTGAEAAGISFDGSGSTSPSGLWLTFAWDFGDGTTATGMQASHTYADNGTYTVTLTVSDGHLANSAATVANVFNVAPTATFNHPGTTKEGSKFTLSLTNPLDPSPVDQAAGFTYAFDCGSGYGAFSTFTSASCPTVDNGAIAIRAKLRDKDGGEHEYVASQTVTNVAPNVTLSAAGSLKIKVGGSLTVNGSFTDAGAQDGPWTVIIDWGNGTTTQIATTLGGVPPQSRSYPVAGTYQVRMKVTDKDGGTGTSSPVTVKVQ